jgi:signal transduction histidine kinase
MKLGLMGKAVISLLVIGGAPLVVGVLLARQVALVAESVAVGEAERLNAALDRARHAYAEALDARKTAFQRAADALAARPTLAAACHNRSLAVEPVLDAALAADPALIEVTLHAADRRVSRSRPAPVKALTLGQSRPLAGAPACVLSTVFATTRGAELAEDYVALGEVLREHRHLERIRADLPLSYQLVFVLIVGGFAVVTTAAAIVFARHTTRRLARLVAATRRVAEGDLATRVDDPGRDEIADLAHAFDAMVGQLARSRAEIDYLQKIGAWQEVARRLAHEIKNPLTPIQLAVQELHKQYRGDDPAFRRVLEDARDIVSEEIAGLRRLVDAFSAFGKLPRVEPRPLDLAHVVEDVTRDPIDPPVSLEVVPPPAPITVAGDRLLLRRALTNLVENAAQAGAKKVRVAWKLTGGSVSSPSRTTGPACRTPSAGAPLIPTSPASRTAPASAWPSSRRPSSSTADASRSAPRPWAARPSSSRSQARRPDRDISVAVLPPLAGAAPLTRRNPRVSGWHQACGPRCSMSHLRWGCVALAALAGLVWQAREVRACGCFAPPDPSVPVVQAGERISSPARPHHHRAHPDPVRRRRERVRLAPPAALGAGARARHRRALHPAHRHHPAEVPASARVRRHVFSCQRAAGRTGEGARRLARSRRRWRGRGRRGLDRPVRLRGATRRLQTELLEWLDTNHYFVPAGTDDAVGPYIRRGAYFLALKLKSGHSTGDLQRWWSATPRTCP